MSPYKLVELGTVAEFINGFAFKPTDWNGKGKKIIRIQNLTDANKPYNFTDLEVPKKYHVKKGDILVSWSATIDVYEWQEETALLNQHIFKVVPDYNVLDKGYFKYALKQAIQSMLRFTHGSTMKHINRNEFLSTKIPLPPLEEQKRIANILDKADALRQKRSESIRLLDEFLRSVFLDMFGDPKTNSKNLPKKKLGILANIIMGQSPKGSSYNFDEIGIPLLNGPTEFGLKFPKEKQWTTSPTKLSKKGDILFCVRGATAGKMNWSDKEYCIGRGLAAISSKGDVSNEYLYIVLQLLYTLFQNTSNGSTFINISSDRLKSLEIPVPSLQESIKFSKIYHRIENLKEKFKHSELQFTIMFKSLVQRAFRGEL